VKFMKTLAFLALALCAAPAFAQINNYVSSSGDVSLTSAATAVTLQQSALSGNLGGRQVTLQWATVYCSVACTVTQAINCTTAATATAGTPVGVPGNTPAAATATFWTASNASGCTTIKIDHLAAGITFTYALNLVRLATAGTTSNYTISIGSITGTANIAIAHGEQQ
jgi:hypothetical protein